MVTGPRGLGTCGNSTGEDQHPPGAFLLSHDISKERNMDPIISNTLRPERSERASEPVPQTEPASEPKQAAPSMRYRFGPRRWEIWFAQLGSHPGTSVQEGCRPVLVISNNVSNTKSDTVTVIPLTSRVKKPWLPSHTTILEGDVRCLDEKFLDSTVLTEQLTTISKSAFVNVLACVVNPLKKKDVIDTIQSYFDFTRKEDQDE